MAVHEAASCMHEDDGLSAGQARGQADRSVELCPGEVRLVYN